MSKPGMIEKEGPLSSSDLFGSATLAGDTHYLGDLSDESLKNLYHLLHSDFESIPENPQHSSEIVKGLQAEIAMRREFHNRGVEIPEIILKKLHEAFKKTIGNIVKQEITDTLTAETPPDLEDEHIHKINDLSEDGVGATEEAGDPVHSHNIDDFLVLPVEIGNYTSDHPGKVNIKKRTDFKVTNKESDGSCGWESTFEFTKIDVEKRLVGGVVYEPDIVDAQNDSASPDEIEKACHRYMVKSQTIGLMHEKKLEKKDVVLVENFLAPCNYIEGTQIVRKGSWVQVHKIVNDDLWRDVKSGKYTGFSMAGRAKDISKAPMFGKSDVSKADAMEFDPLSITKIFSTILKSQIDIEKVIRRRGNQWCVLTHDESKVLGCHDNREDAFRHLAAIEANKQKTSKHLSDTKIDLDEVEKICKPCAKEMKKRGIRKITIKKLFGSSIYKKEPTKIQSLIFDKVKFTKEDAKTWAKDHEFASSNVEETEDSFRLRQKEPGTFSNDSYRTIQLAPGVKAVIGKQK